MREENAYHQRGGRRKKRIQSRDISGIENYLTTLQLGITDCFTIFRPGLKNHPTNFVIRL